MKILFLVPPTLQFEDFVNPPANVGTIKKNEKNFGMVLTDLPLGIISLSAYLKKYISVEIKVLDFNVILNRLDSFEFKSYSEFFENKIKDYIKNTDGEPNYVAISALFTSSHQSIIDLAVISKNNFPNSKIIVGGNYPTAAYTQLLNACEDIDGICYGEGEKPLLELLQANNFDDFTNLSEQWVTRRKLKNPLRKLSHNFIENLDEIPPYDYDCVDVEGYNINPNSSRYSVKENYKIQKETGLRDGEETIGKIESIGKITRSLPIMTSRGCPFK